MKASERIHLTGGLPTSHAQILLKEGSHHEVIDRCNIDAHHRNSPSLYNKHKSFRGNSMEESNLHCLVPHLCSINVSQPLDLFPTQIRDYCVGDRVVMR